MMAKSTGFQTCFGGGAEVWAAEAAARTSERKAPASALFITPCIASRWPRIGAIQKVYDAEEAAASQRELQRKPGSAGNSGHRKVPRILRIVCAPAKMRIMRSDDRRGFPHQTRLAHAWTRLSPVHGTCASHRV